MCGLRGLRVLGRVACLAKTYAPLRLGVGLHGFDYAEQIVHLPLEFSYPEDALPDHAFPLPLLVQDGGKTAPLLRRRLRGGGFGRGLLGHVPIVAGGRSSPRRSTHRPLSRSPKERSDFEFRGGYTITTSCTCVD